MSDILSIGTTAVGAYQRALGTVSNNIANINTEGYSRQEVALNAGAPAQIGTVYLGTGVSVDGVKRLYSEFLEGGLRSSFSGLNTQEPLVQYANRVIDVLGSEKVGLGSALDSFFSSARTLSTDPASTDARTTFLRDADGLVARFRELHGQLETVATDTRQAIEDNLASFNSLASQLATINTVMHAKPSVDAQAPDILDRRDQILREMSKIAGVQVMTLTNGEVRVGLGVGANQAFVVEGDRALALGARFSDAATGKVDIVVDPYGQAQAVSVTSGTVGGLVTFRQQALEPAQNKLDVLAQALVNEVNDIHRSGIDGRGERGGDLFGIAPVFKIEHAIISPGMQYGVAVEDINATVFHDLQVTYDAGRQRWKAVDLASGKEVFGTNTLTLNGLRIDIAGQPADLESFIVRAFQRPAGGITLVQEDPQKLAAAALFRVTSESGNTSGASAEVDYDPQALPANPLPALADKLARNLHASAGVSFTNTASANLVGVASIPAGYRDVGIYLDAGTDTTLDLQIFTRDGRHLVGRELSDDDREVLLQTRNGFVDGSTYSAAYLDQSGKYGYRGMSVLYGARVRAAGDPVFDAENNLQDNRAIDARLQSATIPTFGGATNVVVIAAGAVKVNGVALGELRAPAVGLQAKHIAAWVNMKSADTGVTARAVNEIRAPAASIALRGALTVNGTDITPPAGGFASAAALVQAINDQRATTGVEAVLGADGSVTLTNTAGNEGTDIVIGKPAGYDNALGLASQLYRGNVEYTHDSEVRIELGTGGSPADLARMGLRTAAYIDGAAPEDLLVFATGVGTGKVAADYTVGTIDRIAAQRAQPLEIAFTAADRYRITDVITGTVLAERDYDRNVGVVYGDMRVTLSAPPAAGDLYRIDGNADGRGNNRNILRIADLEQDDSVLPGGKTLTAGYSDLVGSVGTIASQAKIAQQAMQVVNQQAIEARDEVSGVNLDQEAADLVRFQQAYQAAAKTLQVATQLFDYIAQIR